MKKIIRKLYKKSEDTLSGHGLDRYYLVRKGAKFFRNRLKSDFVIIDGQKMFLDHADSLRLSINRVYEEFETAVVKKLIEKNDIVVDIGANIGYYTLIFARAVGKEGKVFAFEPEPTNFDLLTKNLEINNYKNVVFVKKAVSKRNEKTCLYINNENLGGHTMIDFKESNDFIEIESVRLDDYFNDLDVKINFIKIDIEGFEIEAIKGMTSILRKNDDVKMMIEFNPYLIKKFGWDAKKFLNLLEGCHFQVYNIEKKNRIVCPTDFEELQKKCKPIEGNNTNLLCVKGNKIPFLKV